MMITPEEKLLRLVIKDQATDRNYPIRQEMPRCPVCKITIDIMDFSIKVDFRDVVVGGKTFTLAEPYCPRCLKKVPARPYLNH